MAKTQRAKLNSLKLSSPPTRAMRSFIRFQTAAAASSADWAGVAIRAHCENFPRRQVEQRASWTTRTASKRYSIRSRRNCEVSTAWATCRQIQRGTESSARYESSQETRVMWSKRERATMHPRARKTIKLSVLTLLLLVLSGYAQDFQIRTRVDLVVVPVTVKGSGDRLITDLTRDDFVVYEDGRKQTITNFTTDPVPLSAAVLVDTGLTPGSLSKVQQTFPALAGAFSDFDEVAVYRFDKFVAKVLDFSRDSAVVETAMKTLREVQPDTATYPTSSRGPFSTPAPVTN